MRNCDWGSDARVHTAWLMIEVDNKCQALLVVQPMLRSKVRALKLVKSDPEIVKEWN